MENYLWTQTENLKSQNMALRVVRRLDLEESEAFDQPISPGSLIALKSAALKLLTLPARLGKKENAKEGKPETKDVESRLARRLQGGVGAQPVKNTRLIEVSYTGPDPALAASIVNTLTEEFIEQHLEGKYDATTRASDFLRRQLEDLQIQVEQSEQELLDYAQRNSILNLSERETIARKRLVDLSDELTEAESELITRQSRFEAAQSASKVSSRRPSRPMRSGGSRTGSPKPGASWPATRAALVPNGRRSKRLGSRSRIWRVSSHKSGRERLPVLDRSTNSPATGTRS